MAKFTDAIKPDVENKKQSHYYFLSYDRRVKKDSEKIRRDIAKTLLDAKCTMNSNEESSMLIKTTLSYLQVKKLLLPHIKEVFHTFFVLTQGSNNKPIGFRKNDTIHQEGFKKMIADLRDRRTSR
ncbi:hypothetical protein CLV51_1011720 [Chitinophaga niastensis]|uniref:Uncharacterized protein n=1 Tax=Chitinophaga niastensis TaxID=536980 RepID=A0A2P8HW28_CHINA|nr:hypothetical protein [Chitinophaga niastensis]PSL50375.1 hypothetical protein CLV51_1011720 [Chitinophaga niastensis]